MKKKERVNKPDKIIPFDMRFISYLIICISFISLLLGVLLLTNLAYIPYEDSRPGVFGIIKLISEKDFGTYFLFVGIFGIVSAYGLLKGNQYAWWCIVGFLSNGSINGILMFPRFIYTSIIPVIFQIGMIVWLIHRREIYDICFLRKNK